MTVAVVGASGKTGRAVATALQSRGERVVGVGRGDWSRLAEVLTGCSAVSIIAPNLHPDEPGLVQDVLDSAERASVDRVVYHSVAAPFVPELPHHLGKARAEDRVRRSSLTWTILQPCAYVQNYLPALQDGGSLLRVPYDVHRLFGLVDLVDVAEATATVLLEDGHAGATYELGGPRLVSVADMAGTATRILGRAIVAEPISPESWAAGAGTGLGAREVSWLLAMFDYYDRHGLPAGSLAMRHLLAGRAHSLEATLSRELGPPDADRSIRTGR